MGQTCIAKSRELEVYAAFIIVGVPGSQIYMKLAMRLFLAAALLFTGAPRSSWIDAGDQIVAHAGGAQPWTVREVMESWVDDRISAIFASEASAFHCCPLTSPLIHRPITGTNSNKADIKIYTLNAAFLI
jgi:hypothetical protein